MISPVMFGCMFGRYRNLSGVRTYMGKVTAV
jgi:hypothetical protein